MDDVKSKFNIKKIFIIFAVLLVSIGVMALPYIKLIASQLFEKDDFIYEPIPLSKDAEVIKVLSKAQDLDVKELYAYGNEMEMNNKFKEAYNLYKKVLDSHIDSNDALLVYADVSNCYLGIFNFDKAIEYADKSLEMINEDTKPENIYYAYHSAATAYYYRELYSGFVNSYEIIKLLEKVLSIQMDNNEYKDYFKTRNLQKYGYLANMYNYSYSLHNPEKAIKYLNASYNLNPEDGSLKLDMATIFLELNDTKNAKKLINEYKNKYGQNMNLLTAECLLHIKTGEYKKAKKILNKLRIVSISERYRWNYYTLSSAYHEATGDMEKAKAYYEKFIENNKYGVFVYSTIRAEERLGLNFDDIREEIRLQNEEYNKISLELEQPISD